MSIIPVSSTAIDAAQRALQTPETISGGMVQGHGKLPLTSFGETLAAQINEQASIALNPQSPGRIPPTTYKGVALQMIEGTQSLQANAGQAVQNLMKGEGSLHSAMIAMEEASVSFQMLVEMRNKVVEMLQELMRMQV